MSKYRPVRDMRVGLVTVRHMLSHTGGWRRETLDPMFKGKEIARYLRTKSPANKDAILRFMMYQPLQTMPGRMSTSVFLRIMQYSVPLFLVNTCIYSCRMQEPYQIKL